MERRGLLVRESCPSDTRGAFIVLTPAGRAAIEAAAPLHVEHVRRWFVSVLTPVQLDAVSEVSAALLAGLDSADCGAEEACRDDAGAEEACRDEAAAEEARLDEAELPPCSDTGGSID